MTVAVDTNVLLDLHTDDPLHFARSATTLRNAGAEGPLIIGEVVYAELATRMPQDVLDTFLGDLGIGYEASPTDALFAAGATYLRYIASRSAEIQCPNCGATFGVACPSCGQSISWRQHLVSDFLVGAHAQALAGALLTRDRGVFPRFFPGLSRYD